MQNLYDQNDIRISKLQGGEWFWYGTGALVVFQAALGMWTVTLNLLPLVVMGHLLGGFTLLSLLALYWWQLQPAPLIAVKQSLKLLFWPVLLVLAALEAWLRVDGRLPVNLKILLEGLRRTRLSQKVFLMVSREMLMTLTQKMKMVDLQMKMMDLKSC